MATGGLPGAAPDGCYPIPRPSGTTRLVVTGTGGLARALVEAHQAAMPDLDLAVRGRDRANARCLAADANIAWADDLAGKQELPSALLSARWTALGSFADGWCCQIASLSPRTGSGSCAGAGQALRPAFEAVPGQGRGWPSQHQPSLGAQPEIRRAGTRLTSPEPSSVTRRARSGGSAEGWAAAG